MGTAHRSFSTLPDSSKKLITDYLSEISNPLDVDKFMIQVLPFETDDDIERYKIVRQAVDDFIGDLNINIPGMGKKLLTLWHENIFQNGSKKNSSIKLHKRDIIWPMMVIATDINRCDGEFAEQFDPALYDEIIHQYSELINSCCERCEFFIKVLFDYNKFQSTKKPSEKCIDFALSKWEDYVPDLKLNNANEETQRGLVQIVLYNIVRNRITISKVREGVNL